MKKGCSVGANATIVCGTTIGKYSLIGAGSVVSKDVPDFALVYGVPARRHGWVGISGNKLEFDETGIAVDKSDSRKYILKDDAVSLVSDNQEEK